MTRVDIKLHYFLFIVEVHLRRTPSACMADSDGRRNWTTAVKIIFICCVRHSRISSDVILVRRTYGSIAMEASSRKYSAESTHGPACRVQLAEFITE